MFNPESPARPALASDLQIAQMHHAMGAGLAECGATRPAESAFGRSSDFAAIGGARLRLFAPKVAAALNVGRQLFIEYYPTASDEAGVIAPPQLEVVVTRPRSSPISSETITITQSYDPDDGFEVERVVVPRDSIDSAEVDMTTDEFEDWYDDMQRFHDEVGYNTVTTAEVDALNDVVRHLPNLSRPGLRHFLGYVGMAAAALGGFYAIRQDEA